MKITRRQLRKIISEAMKVPVFDKVTPEEIEALRTKARKEVDLDSTIGPEKAEKLRGFESDPDMRDTVTSMYRAFGSEEPDITVSQEDDFFAGQEQYEMNLLKENYPGIVELILAGGMHMVEGFKAAAKVGALGTPIPSSGRAPRVYIGLHSRLSKSLSGVTSVDVSLTIRDKDFAETLDDIIRSGRFGTAAIDRTGRGSFGKLLMRVDAQFPGGGNTNREPLNANEKNSGYRSIKYDLLQRGMRYHLKIYIHGTGTKESNSKLKNLHNLVQAARQ